MAHADRTGVCWPGMRRLAEICRMSLTRVQRAITEMAKLGYFAVERRGRRSNLYRIAARFLHPRGRSVPRAEHPKRRDFTPPPYRGKPQQPATLSPPGQPEGCSAGGTPESHQRNISRDTEVYIKSERDSGSAAEPPAAPEPPAEPASTAGLPAPLARSLRSLGSILDINATADRAKRRQAWLSKLNTWTGQHLEGEAQMAAWELLAEASAGHLPPARQSELDALDGLMRRCEPVP